MAGHPHNQVRRRAAAAGGQTGTLPSAGAVDGDPAPWLNEDQQRAWRAVQVMQARLHAALTSQLAMDSTLSYPDYVVLVVLTDAPTGAARIFELARHLGWERSRVSHHITRMEDRGLVRRERCDADRRGSYVLVTGQGRRAIEAAAPGHVRAVRRLFIDVLTPAQLEAMAKMSERVIEAIDRPGCPGDDDNR